MDIALGIHIYTSSPTKLSIQSHKIKDIGSKENQ